MIAILKVEIMKKKKRGGGGDWMTWRMGKILGKERGRNRM
jgi:hypothetical protein